MVDYSRKWYNLVIEYKNLIGWYYDKAWEREFDFYEELETNEDYATIKELHKAITKGFELGGTLTIRIAYEEEYHYGCANYPECEDHGCGYH